MEAAVLKNSREFLHGEPGFSNERPKGSLWFGTDSRL